MNWTNHKHYAESSDSDGKFRISKTAQRRKTKIVMLYRLWMKSWKSQESWVPMGVFDSADDAKKMVGDILDDDARVRHDTD